MKIRGSCLCGAVRFDVEPPFIRAGHCHCERCRKHSGTAVCTQARVSKDQFRLLERESFIRAYGKGQRAVKAFCVNCGSSLFGGDWPEGDEVSIRMGAFDDDPGIRPQYHTFVGDRAYGTTSLITCRSIREFGASTRRQPQAIANESDRFKALPHQLRRSLDFAWNYQPANNGNDLT